MRRTTSIDASWPEGFGKNLHLSGRARDIRTPAAGGRPVVIAEDRFEADLKPDRTILSIEADPPRSALSRLVGVAGGGGLRRALAEVVPDEKANSTPLYLILDDIAGASLVSGWAWSQWEKDWLARARASLRGVDFDKVMENRVGVCITYAPGSETLTTLQQGREGFGNVSFGGDAPDLRNPEDPDGWHEFPPEKPINMRRARRIDVWVDDAIRIDAAFQDSASTPQGGRRAVHEYSVRVTADSNTLEVLTIDAQPRILPHPECPSATQNMVRLIGTPLPAMREKVLAELRGAAGCTHLNDAMRALADVPALLDHLPERVPA